jgi:hypothetical protein
VNSRLSRWSRAQLGRRGVDLGRTRHDQRHARSDAAGLADHSTLGDLMAADGRTSGKTVAGFARIGIDQTALGAELQSVGADSFDMSWRSLLGCVAAKHERLL